MQKIYFVTGKGGVGKSQLAHSLALKFAQDSQRVLLAELGDESFYQYPFGRPVTFEPQELSERLDLSLWTGETALRDYLLHYLKLRPVVDLFFQNKVAKPLIQAAPALSELSLLGKATSGIRKVGPSMDYDVIVIDSFATGHFRALWQAPVGLGRAIGFGPMGQQSREMVDVLKGEQVEVVLATLPEELPLQEAAELALELRQNWDKEVKIFVNRCLPDEAKVLPSLALRLKSQQRSLEGFKDFSYQKVFQVFSNDFNKVSQSLLQQEAFSEGVV